MKKLDEKFLNLLELSSEEKSKRGILGRLYGPVATTISATRNGRYYTEELWTNVFEKNKLVKEMLENGGIPGELQHPEERTQIDNEKIAIIMPEAPHKDPKTGLLMGFVDILDTPNGRIAYALAKYGYRLGISSRGTGDVIEDENGNESVDPESYNFTCFDLVTIPSVEEARMDLHEGLNSDSKLKLALCESLNKSTKDEQKIMKETLKELNIDIDNDKKVINESATPAVESKPAINEGQSPVKDVDIDGSKELKSKEAVDNGSEMEKNLTETLKVNSELKAQIKSLQEELAASNSKVDSLTKEASNYKFATSRLSILAKEGKELKKEVAELQESLKSKTGECRKLVLESKKHKEVASKSLTESISTKDNEIKKLNESLTSQKSNYESKIKELNESITSLKTASDAKAKELTESLNKTIKIKESYKKLAKKTVSKYIESQAVALGLDVNEVYNKLPKTYTFDDIKRVCESLSEYDLNMSRLPFRVDSKVKMSINRSTRDPLDPDHDSAVDVDQDLLDLAHM